MDKDSNQNHQFDRMMVAPRTGLLCLFLFCVNLYGALANFMNTVAFIIMDQPENSDLSALTYAHLDKALEDHGVKFPLTHKLHKDFDNTHGGWTYLTLFSEFLEIERPTPNWYVILHESSRVDVKLLEQLLSQHDHTEEVFIGKALTDPSRVIIHHFQGNMKFKFPDASAGIILSHGLVSDMAKYYKDSGEKIRGLPTDFSIDPEFEVAQAIYYRHVDSSDGTPVELTHSDMLCSNSNPEGDECAVWSWREKRPCLKKLDSADSLIPYLEKVSFAVKTCEKYHAKRLPVIKQTWAKATIHLDLASEKEDSTFGTKVFTGVTHNTEAGHCMKTEAIIKNFHERANVNGEELDWLVIADDDTILSVARLVRLLSCYDPSTPVALGQRYGFNVVSGSHGYDYPTGGAGMILSKALVAKMIDNKGHCECHRPDAPDDMHLGSCFGSLGVSLTHVDQMHQARPEDYHAEMLKDRGPISFHKFWETDPLRTYAKWFLPHDKDLIELLEKKGQKDGEKTPEAKDEL